MLELIGNEATASYSTFMDATGSGLEGGLKYTVPAPGELERDELLLSKLKARGWGRLHYFRSKFSGSWGCEGEKPFSPRAQEAFFRFLKHAQFPKGITPSIFLTRDGHIELSWEDELGKAIQVEFGSSETEVFVEATGTEVTIPNKDSGRAISLALASV